MHHPQTPLPLACSLSGGAVQERQRWLEELKRAVVGRHWTPGGLVVRFRHDTQLEADLRRLIAAEARCCPFLTLALRPSGEVLELEVSGQSEARPIIEEMFGASDVA